MEIIFKTCSEQKMLPATFQMNLINVIFPLQFSPFLKFNRQIWKFTSNTQEALMQGIWLLEQCIRELGSLSGTLKHGSLVISLNVFGRLKALAQKEYKIFQILSGNDFPIHPAEATQLRYTDYEIGIRRRISVLHVFVFIFTAPCLFFISLCQLVTIFSRFGTALFAEMRASMSEILSAKLMP